MDPHSSQSAVVITYHDAIDNRSKREGFDNPGTAQARYETLQRSAFAVGIEMHENDYARDLVWWR